MEEIIEAGSAVDSRAFPKLKSFQLINLPKLSSICHNMSLAWPLLETITIKACDELRNFPSTIENASKLRGIQCNQAWWSSLVWPNDHVRDHFQNFCQFIWGKSNAQNCFNDSYQIWLFKVQFVPIILSYCWNLKSADFFWLLMDNG